MSIEVVKEYKNEKFDDTLLVIKEKHGTNTKVYLFDKKGENFKGSFDTENEEVGTGIFFGIFLSFLLGGIIYAIVTD